MNQKYFNDIVSQPANWISCLSYCKNEGYDNLVRAIELLKSSRKIYIVGIGASYNAALAFKHLLKPNLTFIEICEASEFLYHENKINENDCILFLSRSGKSIELVKIIELFEQTDIKTIAVCNDLESPLFKKSKVPLFMNSAFDHNISVNTYTAMLCIGLAIKLQMIKSDNFQTQIENLIHEALQVEKYIKIINDNLVKSSFIDYNKNFYLLGRNENFIHASATALLFEEGAKKPAVPKYTSSFRHGTQEVISDKLAILIWLEETSPSYDHDLKLVEDLRNNKVSVLSVSDLKMNDGISESNLPVFNFINLLTKHIIGQVFVYHLATNHGIDTDQFLYCNYIVEHEGGL